MKEQTCWLIACLVGCFTVCFVTVNIRGCEEARFEANSKARIHSSANENFDRPIDKEATK